MTTRQVLGGAVREIRKGLGIGLRSFATDVGIAPGYLSDIEHGRKQPREDVRERIRVRLGVSLDSITYVVDGARALPRTRDDDVNPTPAGAA